MIGKPDLVVRDPSVSESNPEPEEGTYANLEIETPTVSNANLETEGSFTPSATVRTVYYDGCVDSVT